MIARTSRRGITLTEILISILLLAVGVTSLMTLFPLGLLRLRDAQRYSRSATLTESAAADLETRDLLNKRSFLNSNTGPYYNMAAFTPWPYDPWVQDTPGYTGGKFLDPIAGPNFGAYRGTGVFNVANAAPHDKAAPRFNPGPGLPVAYDPLWRHAAGVYPGNASEARFASGIGFVRQDPDGGAPSAHGLQRITNFPSGTLMNVPDIFVSPEDVVLQSDKDSGSGVGAKSPIVPDLTTGGTNALTGMLEPMNEWRYTWMFTGQQADCTNGTVFVGDVVVFENRPWSLDPVTQPFGGASSFAAAGETVVEAVFGYTNQVATTNNAGYGASSKRSVLLRWPASMSDPEIRVGQWIADVTYERNAVTDYTRAYVDPTTGGANGYYPYQRCHWYQIAKRTEAGPATNQWDGDAAGGMREMTVWTSSPLKALTLLKSSGGVNVVGSPIHVNAALVSPYVVNVFPRTIYTR